MKLSQLFSSQAHIEEQTGAPSRASRSTAQINRQIRSLVPGQTISGEIVGRNGSEVQIRVSEDMVLNARVDQNIHLETGKNMTFEVKNNGNALTLSPLFTNVSTDVNVLKALDMASMPVNPVTVAMTEQLMEAGLPVNKSSLQQVYREINSFPQAQISDIVELHRLNLPVNEANVSQAAAYRTLSHQLSEGIENVLNALPEVIDSLRAAEGPAGAMKLWPEILRLIAEADPAGGNPAGGNAAGEAAGGLREGLNALPGEILPPAEGPVPGAGATAESSLSQGASSSQGYGGLPGEGADILLAENARTEGEAPSGGGQTLISGENLQESGLTARPPAEELPAEGASPGEGAFALPEAGTALSQSAAQELLDALGRLPLSGEELAQAATELNRFAAGEGDAGQLAAALGRLAERAAGNEELLAALDKMFSGPAFGRFINGQLKERWTIRPREVASKERVEQLYQRLERQLRGLAQTLESAGQSGSAAFRAASGMTQNIDFLQQINQMYAYVQLPLRLQHGDAHGELYVYTNKKHLAREDGNISALLHLDMENLGPVDVYVAMNNSKVNTKFYVRDEEMLDFLADHMELLTQRLKRRGYDCSFSMSAGKEEDTASGGALAPILGRERGVVLSQYALDVRT